MSFLLHRNDAETLTHDNAKNNKLTQKHLHMIRQNIIQLLLQTTPRFDCFFKKLLFTMENTTTAGSSQSNISRIYI